MTSYRYLRMKNTYHSPDLKFCMAIHKTRRMIKNIRIKIPVFSTHKNIAFIKAKLARKFYLTPEWTLKNWMGFALPCKRQKYKIKTRYSRVYPEDRSKKMFPFIGKLPTLNKPYFESVLLTAYFCNIHDGLWPVTRRMQIFCTGLAHSRTEINCISSAH